LPDIVRTSLAGVENALVIVTVPLASIVLGPLLETEPEPLAEKSPQLKAPERSRLPAVSIAKAFVPALTVPPLWICRFPPVTWLVAPFRPRLTRFGTTRLPPLTVNVPETLALEAVTVPPLTVKFE
jgi:hypothetical protein